MNIATSASVTFDLRYKRVSKVTLLVVCRYEPLENP